MLPSFLYILDPASFDKARKAQDLNFIPGTILFPFLVNVTKGWWCTLDWVEVELQILKPSTMDISGSSILIFISEFIKIFDFLK